jgi:tetratricopeptide (TPR) repeat protein
MGFPIPQARAALAANNNDVQAALNQLLASEGGHGSNGRGTPNSQTRGSPAPASSASIPSQQQPALPRRRDREIFREQEQPVDASSPASTTAGVQAQAEQLLAQATVMGRGMFSKASSFLKEKSAQVQKVVEEHRSSSGAGGSAGGVNGRPRWAPGPGVDDRGFRDGDEPRSGFKDSGLEPEVRIPRRVDRQRTRERVKEPVATPIQEPEIDLFAPPEPTTSLPQLFDVRASTTPPLPIRPRQRQQRQQSPSSQPPPPKFQRNTTAISHTITSLKSEANAAFKLGQFADAENLYTRAIDSLGRSSNNDNSVYYVLLLNNRANARMRIGNVNGAVRDCEAVVGILTTNQFKLPDEFDALGTGGGSTKHSTTDEVKIDWEPAYETAFGKIQISISNGSSELVDLGEGLIKAIKRRADAYEGMEKWGQAKKDWEWLRSTSWVRDNMRGEAGRGVERCIRMVGGGGANGSNTMNGFSSSPSSSSRISTKRKPTSKTIPSRDTKPSEALQNLRSTTAQAEAEDQARYELKDTVDSKLSAWKSGKETNIRALLASLDLVLWEELLNNGGSSVKVGMHEVVTPAQVKIKYMKAVARVHPDKVRFTFFFCSIVVLGLMKCKIFLSS